MEAAAVIMATIIIILKEIIFPIEHKPETKVIVLRET